MGWPTAATRVSAVFQPQPDSRIHRRSRRSARVKTARTLLSPALCPRSEIVQLMNRTSLFQVARSVMAAASFITLGSAYANAQTEIVLHTKDATRVNGAWQHVSDTTAASGSRLWNPDRGAGKLSTAFASPTDYFELTFNAEAYQPYRIWLRGKAENNAWTNDSAFIQFSGSLDYYGAAINRIGTTRAMVVSVEACSGCGVSGWGWEDNGYGGAGLLVYFATTGPQTIRIQRREDGMSIDQVVLSRAAYYSSSPGKTQGDTTILPHHEARRPRPPPPAPEPPPGARESDRWLGGRPDVGPRHASRATGAELPTRPRRRVLATGCRTRARPSSRARWPRLLITSTSRSRRKPARAIACSCAGRPTRTSTRTTRPSCSSAARSTASGNRPRCASDDQRHDGEHRKLCRLRRVWLGMVRQRLRRVGKPDLLRHDRTADAARPAP